MIKIIWPLVFCTLWNMAKLAATESDTALLTIEIEDPCATADEPGELIVFYGDFYSLQYKLLSVGVEESMMVKNREIKRLNIPLARRYSFFRRSEEHTSELQSRENLVCRLLLDK